MHELVWHIGFADNIRKLQTSKEQNIVTKLIHENNRNSDNRINEHKLNTTETDNS